MRVGSKRLREAVRVFSPAIPTKSRKRVLPTVERLNDLLGEVRDCDVLQQAFVKLARKEPGAEALGEVVRSLRVDRKAHHKALLLFLKDLHKSAFALFYEKLMRQMLSAEVEGEPTVGGFAAEAVGLRLDAVVANMGVLESPEQVEAFHRQRIRVKKLKYALEPFMVFLPPSLEPVYDQIGELQELMGKVHDVDVQTEVLRDWQKERGKQEGLKLALQHLRGQRAELVKLTQEHGEAMATARFDAELAAALQATAVP
jgi:CHAD domain-containing protein